ncbi:DNA cytosine methyltransferase [Staphylococcus pseudintermedius]|uniref:DNA cytosine methyltransferase n=1 Tax=Staphylococcus pseudintermedius TaxID=283734 RepID=UPI000CE579FF|nr:DNA cytosine methyltransferase [Staphylococcus pseudintermedius]EGQ2810610.1 DNA cytosine methyltransferase [Staphylococcus pseudintermedius]EGQ2831541.1 DNA cytosine methyltransferase [Staphylococcus pseudintermedius]EGQ2969087.1 DNA cytosine methyltransferase [Staphylococcus pseudintermedius]EGQ3039935.1 DNA cytosine methyltransferase [Staphylococcus pseudintermedius]EGQ3547331.1 DNA cytosine methyltransferase [Staphylococcus pseudintermedius]
MTNSVSSSKDDKKRTIAAFFSGVGGIELGFEQTGKFRVVYANEFDKNARITYQANNPNTPLDGRDIHDVHELEVPVTDLIVGGFPCQAFSIAGYRKGFEDERGDLFFELLRFIKTNRPRAIFIENVKNMVTHDHGNTFKVIREALTMNGYLIKWKVLNSKDYGNVPQNRERIYIVGFTDFEAFNNFDFPEPIKLTKSLSDIIDFSSEKDDRYYYREGRQPFYKKLEEEITKTNAIYQWRRQYVRENKTGVVPTLTANMGTGGHNVPIILSDKGIRKLTPRETFNAQGYPVDFKLPDGISNGQLYKQSGNSVVVPVIKRIALNIDYALSRGTKKEMYSIETGSKYYIMYTNMNGRFMGESYLAKVLNSEEELDSFAKEKDIHYLNKEQYEKNIKKNKKIEFYSYEYSPD